MSSWCTEAPALWNELRRGAIVEARVISALMLREIHTINGNSKLGYLWVLIQSIFGIGAFWTVRHFMGASQAPHGMGIAMFLAIGFGIWNIARVSLRGLRVNSKDELRSHIEHWLAECNADPVPFRWKWKMEEVHDLISSVI